jgi:hypothetical protein
MAIIENEFMELTQGLDLEAFWAENEQCRAFTTDKPRCMLSFSPDDHWIFEFVDVPSTLRYYPAILNLAESRCRRRRPAGPDGANQTNLAFYRSQNEQLGCIVCERAAGRSSDSRLWQGVRGPPTQGGSASQHQLQGSVS